MANELRESIRSNPSQGFQSRPRYSAEGDFLALFFRDEDYHAHRVDALLTVYLSMNGDKLVGVKLKGVRRILETLGRFDCLRVVPDGKTKVMLHVLLLPGIALANDPEQRERYEEVEEATRGVGIDMQELQPA
jgi:hypothetical protein